MSSSGRSGLTVRTALGRELGTELDAEVSVGEEELPIRIRWRGGSGLRVVVDEGVVTSAEMRHHDGSREWTWHPFQRPEDQRGTEWAGRVSYGPVRVAFRADDFGCTLVVHVGPSGISAAQVDAMRETIARVASELVWVRLRSDDSSIV